MRGRDYVIPDDVKELVLPVLAHRILVADELGAGRVRAREALGRVLESVAAPL